MDATDGETYADTEWSEILHSKGILPQKATSKKELELTEEDITKMVNETIAERTKEQDMSEKTLDELNEIEDEITEEDEKFFEMYKAQRMTEILAARQRKTFGSVLEISKQDYVTEVNEAGDGIWVILHVYENSVPLCKIIDFHMRSLAQKFPEVKFVRSQAAVCIPNYPESRLPTFFIYRNGKIQTQFIGASAFQGGLSMKQDDLEWQLSQTGAFQTELEENPRPTLTGVFGSQLNDRRIGCNSIAVSAGKSNARNNESDDDIADDEDFSD